MRFRQMCSRAEWAGTLELSQDWLHPTEFALSEAERGKLDSDKVERKENRRLTQMNAD